MFYYVLDFIGYFLYYIGIHHVILLKKYVYVIYRHDIGTLSPSTLHAEFKSQIEVTKISP